MIETPRLILRVPVAADRPAPRAMWADPRVMADLGPVKDAAASDATLDRHDGYRGAGLGFWVVERREDGAVIGFCGLKPGAENTPIAGEIEIGWLLAAPFWGAGYAQEAAQASLDWGWTNTGAPRIIAITAARNMKSQKLMERLGMRRLAGGDFDHPLYAEGDPLRA